MGASTQLQVIGQIAVTCLCLMGPLSIAKAGACLPLNKEEVAVDDCEILPQEELSDFSEGRATARSVGNAWIPSDWNSVPFMFVPSEAQYSVRASLTHLVAFGRQNSSERDSKIRDSLGFHGPSQLSGYKNPLLDVWATLDFGAQASNGLVRGRLGADFAMRRNSAVGLTIERGELTNGDDVRLATYFEQRAPTGWIWGLQGGWGNGYVEDQNALVSNTYFNAKVARELNFGQVTVAPSTEFATAIRHSSDGISGTSSTSGTIILASRLSRSFDIEDRARLEPYVVIKQAIDTGEGEPSSHTLESGLKLDAPSHFSLRASTAVENSKPSEAPAVSSRFELQVPLN